MIFQHPFTCIIAGPTKVGKTEWSKRLVNNANEMISPKPHKIIWCYTEWQKAYKDLENVELCEGLPNFDRFKNSSNEPKLLILDDFMDTLKGDARLTQLFTRGAHHWNVSVIHICQALFFDGLRTARINAHYIILMKSPADKLQIANFAKQMYPGMTKYFMEAYKNATERPFGYLLVDTSPVTDDQLRLRTDIFPEDVAQSVYVPK